MKFHTQVADLLLTCKANPDIQQPLKKAAQYGRCRMIEVLIRHRANRLATDEDGCLPYEHMLLRREKVANSIGGAGTSCEQVLPVSAKSGKAPERIAPPGTRLEHRMAKIIEGEEDKRRNGFVTDEDRAWEDDEAFATMILRPTKVDLERMQTVNQERVTLARDKTKQIFWAQAGLAKGEKVHFKQDLCSPPEFFLVTSEDPVVLTGANGEPLHRADVGTVWQQVGLEPVGRYNYCQK